MSKKVKTQDEIIKEAVSFCKNNTFGDYKSSCIPLENGDPVLTPSIGFDLGVQSKYQELKNKYIKEGFLIEPNNKDKESKEAKLPEVGKRYRDKRDNMLFYVVEICGQVIRAEYDNGDTRHFNITGFNRRCEELPDKEER